MDGESTVSPTVDIFPLSLNRISLTTVCNHCLLSFCYAPPKNIWPCLLCKLSSCRDAGNERGRVTSRCLCWGCSVPSTGFCAFSGSLQFLDVALTSQTQHPDIQISILTALPPWFEVIYKSVESTLHPISQVKMGNNTSSSPDPWETSLVTFSETFKLSTSTFWLQSNIYIYILCTANENGYGKQEFFFFWNKEDGFLMSVFSLNENIFHCFLWQCSRTELVH